MLAHRRAFSVLIPALMAGIAWCQFPGTSTPPPNDLKRGFDAITEAKGREYLRYLVEECEGRGTGQPGYQKAADYVAAHFKRMGLKPAGDNGTYFQNLTFYRNYTRSLKLTDAAGNVLATDGMSLNATRENIDVTAPVIIVRATDARARLTDGQVAELNGKLVLLVAPAGRSAIRSQVALVDTKGVLTVVDGAVNNAPAVRRTAGATGTSVSGRISRATVEGLGSRFYGFLRRNPMMPAMTYMPGMNLRLTAESRSEEVKVPNVVGLLEGSDPTLKSESVGVGAHLDHLGISNGVVYPGADDDGSGSAAIMMIAEGMARNPVKPQRSVLFMAFCAEEMGLVGSAYLAEKPPVPLDKMVAELQMDMVGRDSYGAQNGDPSRMDKLEENLDTMRLVGSKRISTDLDRVIQEMNRYVGFRFKYDAEDVYTRSDHYNFAKKGVPIAFMFDGFTPDYHQPTDTLDKINFLKLTNAAKLYYLTAMSIANTPQAPRKDVGR